MSIEMKGQIYNDAKTGGVIGFVSALCYSIIALLVVELFLPIPNPTQIVIFDNDFSFLLSIIIPTAPFWLLGSTIIGGITMICFRLYLNKRGVSKKRFVIVCTTVCALLASPLLLLTIIRVSYIMSSNNAYHLFIHPIIDSLLEIGFPCMIYILAGLFTSNYLYNNQSM